MPQFNPRPFVPQTNTSILNAIRNQASRDYRDRIPVATQANITNTQRKIFEYKAGRNEFVDALVNQIGFLYAEGTNFENPLAKFKQGTLAYGDTIEKVQIGLIKAKTYDPRREYLEQDLFGVERPDVQSEFHTRNRRNVYKITINEQELKAAFREDWGLSTFITQLMSVPATADQLDEYLLTVNLFREMYDNGGYFKVQVPNVQSLTSTTADAQSALRAVRNMADTLPFVSNAYNAAHMPMAINRDELELFVTPEFNSAVDVNALAGAFNIDRALMPTRQTVIRQQDMNIPGAQAILTTRNFFVIADTYYETANQPNAAGRTQNYFLHHDQIVSASRFAPAILFTTEPSTVIVINDPVIATIGDIVINDRAGVAQTTVPRGDFYQVIAPSTTTPTGGDLPLLLGLSGQKSNYTTLSQNGTLYVGNDEGSAQITISAMDTDGNPVKNRVVTLTGDVSQVWPNPQVVPAPTV